MNRMELLNLLEMDSPEDFGYFEQFAEIVECEDEIDFGDFFFALSKADSDTLAEINENYFTELERIFPENCDDVLEIIESVWNNLKLLCQDLDDETCRREYAQQLFKFHEWYVAPDKAKLDGAGCSVMNALCEYRASKLENSEHSYDFDDALDYEFDDVSILLGGYGDNEDYTSKQNN